MTPSKGPNKGTIIAVDDDKVISNLITKVLTDEGYNVSVADTAFKARGLLERLTPTLVILDRRLPDADGLELCQEIRKKPQLAGVPVLFLTAKGTTADKVVGLKMGGDDYLTKPFSPEELVVRIEVLLRRAGQLEETTVLEADGLKIDLTARKVFLIKKEIALSPKEFDLLAVLLSRKNRVLTRQFLLQHVWGYGEDVELSTRVVDVTFSHLREKLGPWGKRISAVRGYGYRLDLQ
ncbi:MAG: response regulator transcription factor [Elusimicrobia bacterium]|nr:response regulator transcription factor [Elusimicrobiota bacterium]